MVMDPMLVMAIRMASAIPAIAISQGDAGTGKDHNSRNCEYFHNVAFHGFLLSPYSRLV
jgi:hypothetical protein